MWSMAPSKSLLDLPVLVLNANFEPLSVCNTRRAINLVLDGRAEVILNSGHEIRTPSTIYPCPSIVRLSQMIKRPRPRIKLSKSEIFRRDHYTCQYCGKNHGSMTIDHVYPRHLGGEHVWDNVVTACATCNRKKGGKLLKDTRMHLRKPPAQPRASASYRFSNYVVDNEQWQQFIEGW